MSCPHVPTQTQRPVLSTDDLARVAAALADLAEQLSAGWTARVRCWAAVSQTELASKIGVDQRTLSAWETGQAAPRSAELALRYHAILAAMENELVTAGKVVNATDDVPVPAVQRP